MDAYTQTGQSDKGHCLSLQLQTITHLSFVSTSPISEKGQ